MSENASKKIHYLAAIAIVAMVLVSVVAVTRPVTLQTPVGATNQKTLQVTGVGTVSGPPDRAILSLAVQTQASSASQATGDNAATMSKVMAALISIGIATDSIETLSYTLSPIYENNPNQSTSTKIIGYNARNAIQVTTQDFSAVGKAIDAAVSAGANEVQGITFTFSSTTLAKLQEQALGLAVQDANRQAHATASSLGVNLVGPISVTPGYLLQPSTQRYAMPSQTTPIQSGTLEVSATVQVTYQFS